MAGVQITQGAVICRPAGDPVAASGFIAGVARGAGSYSLLFRVQRPVHVVVAVIQFGEWPQNYFFTAF